MMAGIVVRDGRKEDLPQIHRMIHELAEFEGCPSGPQLSVAELERDGFETPQPWYFLIVAECADGALAGYVLCNRAYSSWSCRALYMEDLFVRPQFRSLGIGKRLVAHVCKHGVDVGAHRIDWHVLESNTKAIKFYVGLGARDMHVSEGRAAMRLDRQHIDAIAHQQQSTHTQ